MTSDDIKSCDDQARLPLPATEFQYLYDGGEVFREYPDGTVVLCSPASQSANSLPFNLIANSQFGSDPLQLDVFPDRLTLRRIDSTQNMRRFYRLTVLRDLFGKAVLCKEWGRIGSAGKIQNMYFKDEAAAVDALASIAKHKQKRGYHS